MGRQWGGRRRRPGPRELGLRRPRQSAPDQLSGRILHLDRPLHGRGTRGFEITGDPTEVADQLEHIIEATDLDGFLLEPIFDPTDLEDFARLVVPILRERGRMPASPATGSLREQVTGAAGPHLAADHPGAAFRVTSGIRA